MKIKKHRAFHMTFPDGRYALRESLLMMGASEKVNNFKEPYEAVQAGA